MEKATTEQWSAFPRRWTFLIDPDGIVRRTYEVTDVTAHPDDVLADLRVARQERRTEADGQR